MSTTEVLRRAVWSTYLATYAIIHAFLFYVHLQFAGAFNFIEIAMTLLDAASMFCLYCYIRRHSIKNRGFRLALIAVKFLFVARTAFFLYVLLPNLLPGQGSFEQGRLPTGLGGVLFQMPMAAALLLYSMKRPVRTSRASESLEST